MKADLSNGRNPSIWRARLVASVIGLMTSATAGAVSVDAELLFLVDVTRSVSNSEYSTMLESYAQAFESSDVVSSLQGGQTGSIAASLVFYGSRNQQSVGVGWMEISNLEDAQTFADSIRNLQRPGRPNRSSISDALNAVVPYFGDELGGAANGYESALQSVTILSDSVDNGSRPTRGSREATVQQARDSALASGLDVINAITIGSSGSVDDYFLNNVIGGAVGEAPATVTNVANFAVLTENLTPALAGQIATAVPEPGWWLSFPLAALWFMRRQRPQSYI